MFLIVWLAGAGFAQPPVAIDNVPMCWVINGTDSSITRYIQISSRTPAVDPLIITYTNAKGDQVDVSGGGQFFYGYCDQCSRDTLPVPRIEMFGISQPVFNPFNPTNCDSAISAKIFGVTDPGQITLTLDGSPITFEYDPITKYISALAESTPGTGVHTVVLTATIPTGTAIKSATFDCG